MGFKCGIVGLPNVGKSTLFNALTEATIAADNYPFCTIEPNVGIIAVPDERLHRISELEGSKRAVPTTMEFVDIAGLVAGASHGEGLGNQFLAHIREVDAIAHVVRCFVDRNVAHVSDHIDPLHDIGVVNTELALADLQTLERNLQRAEKLARTGDKDAARRIVLLERARDALDAPGGVRSLDLGEEEKRTILDLNLLTMKPVEYIANVAEDGLRGNPMLEQVAQYAAGHGSAAVAVCAAFEAEIAQLDQGDRQDFLAELGLEESGLIRVIEAGYRLLDLLTFFTANRRETRAWTVKKGTTAPRAAGRVHTDFERGFISAQIIAYEDFMACDGEQGARDAGKMRLEGKDYVMQEGDVALFRFNV